MAGVLSGTVDTMLDELIERPPRADAAGQWGDEISPLIEQIRQGQILLDEAIEFVKAQPGTSYKELYARKLVDIGVWLVIAALFCNHATASDKKLSVARRWLAWRMAELRMCKEQICSGERSIVDEFEVLAGPVPVLE